ncbi:MAG: InlB B-repeat-containing protein [bacterium]
MEKRTLGGCFTIIILLLSATIYFLISASASNDDITVGTIDRSSLDFYNVLTDSGYSKDFETWEQESLNGTIEYRLVDLNIEFGAQGEWIRVYSLENIILAQSWYESFVDGSIGIEYTQYYTVTFMDNNTTLSSQVVLENSLVSAPVVSAVDGKVFAGWDYNLENGIDSKTTITALWENDSYTITFVTSSNDYFPVQEISYEDEFTLPIPTKDGYQFTGWYNGNTQVTDGKYTNTSNIVLYARWEALSYNISFDVNGGSYLNSISAPFNSTVELPSPSKTGSRFAGWYYEGTYVSNTFVFAYNKDIVLTAAWGSADAYFLNFNSNGAGSFEPIEVKKDFQYSLPQPEMTGYTFDGWYYNGARLDDVNDVWMYDNDATAVAKWTIIDYKITYSLVSGTNHPDNPTTYTIETYGLLKYGTRTNYEQYGWYINGTEVTTFTFDKTIGDLAVTFRWQYKYYDVTYMVNGEAVQTNDLSSYAVLAFSTNDYTLRYYTNDEIHVNCWYVDPEFNTKITSLSSFNLSRYFDEEDLEENGIVLYGDAVATNEGTYTATTGLNLTYEYINYGHYPSQQVRNQDTLAALANITERNENGYIEYEGEQYLYQKATIWTPGTVSYTITQKASNNQFIGNNSYYYYHVEPIKWRVLRDEVTSEVTLWCEYLLGSAVYNEEQSYDEEGNAIALNDWETSTIRAYMDTFAKVAFTTEEYNQISMTERTAITDSKVTEDKLFFLTPDELSNPNFGFEDKSTTDPNRSAIISDYTRACGSYATSVHHTSLYWGSPSTTNEKYVYYGSTTLSGSTTNTADCEFRPAMKLSFSI